MSDKYVRVVTDILDSSGDGVLEDLHVCETPCEARAFLKEITSALVTLQEYGVIGGFRTELLVENATRTANSSN